jgi:hypothetical protein
VCPTGALSSEPKAVTTATTDHLLTTNKLPSTSACQSFVRKSVHARRILSSVGAAVLPPRQIDAWLNDNLPPADRATRAATPA